MNVNVNSMKLLVALVALVGAFAMLALDSNESTYAWTLIGTVTGYILGNGVAARSGVPVEPLISKKGEQ